MGEDSKTLFGSSSFDWDAYISIRPDYTLNNFYENIWDYHRAKGAKWTCVHDVGAGPGNVSEILAPRFEHIVLSDLIEFQVEVARHRLASKFGDKFSFKVSPVEDLPKSFPSACTDMITAAECIPLMDPHRAMSTFATLLRPGGTLAIWFHGAPVFENPEITALFRKIFARSLDQFRPMRGTIWEHGMITPTLGLDNIALPEGDWTDIKRIKWNYDLPLGFEDSSEHGFEFERVSRIRPDEEIVHKIDRSFWKKRVDAKWIEYCLDKWMPRSVDYKTPEVKEMYKQLQELMGGSETMHDVTYPTVLILATRSGAPSKAMRPRSESVLKRILNRFSFDSKSAWSGQSLFANLV